MLFLFRFLIQFAPKGCNSRSACSVGTDRMRRVLVWPSPPFQPCTAMIVEPGVMIFNARALRSPNRIRLSTCQNYQLRTMMTSQSLTYIGLPLVGFNAPRLRVPEWITATMQMNLSGSLLAASNWNFTKLNLLHFAVKLMNHTSDDGDSRPVLGNQASSVAARGKHKEGTSILLRSRRNCRNGYSFRRFSGMRLNRPQIIKQRQITDGSLSQQTSLRHHENFWTNNQSSH